MPYAHMRRCLGLELYTPTPKRTSSSTSPSLSQRLSLNAQAALASATVWLLCAALATRRNRGRLHRRLGRLGRRGTEEEEAAAIAALVGSDDPEAILKRAVANFRCLPASQLLAADLAAADRIGSSPEHTSSTNSAALAAKTVPATMGEVTAFLSHSWRDEEEAPGATHRAVGQWARQQRRNLRPTGTEPAMEPTIWLDKACIDQNNIQQSLACLPIFLAGCQTLLVVAGPTYCSRLWCVMELFTFARSERLPHISNRASARPRATFRRSNRFLTHLTRCWCVCLHSGRRPKACRDPSHCPPGR